MTAGKYSFSLERGVDWAIGLTLSSEANPINLTGYSFSFTVYFLKGSIKMLSGFATITDAVEGKLTLSISADQLDSLAFRGRNVKAIYNLIMTRPDETRIKLLKGDVTIYG